MHRSMVKISLMSSLFLGMYMSMPLKAMTEQAYLCEFEKSFNQLSEPLWPLFYDYNVRGGMHSLKNIVLRLKQDSEADITISLEKELCTAQQCFSFMAVDQRNQAVIQPLSRIIGKVSELLNSYLNFYKSRHLITVNSREHLVSQDSLEHMGSFSLEEANSLHRDKGLVPSVEENDWTPFSVKRDAISLCVKNISNRNEWQKAPGRLTVQTNFSEPSEEFKMWSPVFSKICVDLYAIMHSSSSSSVSSASSDVTTPVEVSDLEKRKPLTDESLVLPFVQKSNSQRQSRGNSFSEDLVSDGLCEKRVLSPTCKNSERHRDVAARDRRESPIDRYPSYFNGDVQ